VMAKLDELKLAENTFVIFTSDNGCSPQADFPDLAKHGHNPSHVYRGHKADLFEGGHRVPFLVRWPGTVKPGTTNERLVCLTDVLRTVADAAGVAVPETAGEDSASLLPTLKGEAQPARSAVVHHSINGSFAIREADWKLLLSGDSGGWSEPRPNAKGNGTLPAVQLYNLKDDIGETKNLHGAEPATVERLTKRLEAIVATGHNAVPVVLRKKK
jgi:arylsulfatase A